MNWNALFFFKSVFLKIYRYKYHTVDLSLRYYCTVWVWYCQIPFDRHVDHVHLLLSKLFHWNWEGNFCELHIYRVSFILKTPKMRLRAAFLSSCHVGFIFFHVNRYLSSLFFFSVHSCVCVCHSVCLRALSITKQCLLSPAVKAHQEEEVGQEFVPLPLRPTPSLPRLPHVQLSCLSLCPSHFVFSISFNRCLALLAATVCVC